MRTSHMSDFRETSVVAKQRLVDRIYVVVSPYIDIDTHIRML
jgi:hypothetical protein